MGEDFSGEGWVETKVLGDSSQILLYPDSSLPVA